MEWSPIAKVYDPLMAGSIDGTDMEPHDLGIVRAMNSKYKPNKDVRGIPENTVFVAHLNPNTSETTLESVFSEYGEIKNLRLVKDIVTGISKGYAFIEYTNERSAQRAERHADKMDLDGKTILVDFECERTLPGWIPRRLGGGFGGRKESGQLRFGGKERPFRKPILSNSAKLEVGRGVTGFRERFRNLDEGEKREREGSSGHRSKKRHKRQDKGYKSRSRSRERYYHRDKREKRSQDRDKREKYSLDRERHKNRKSKGRDSSGTRIDSDTSEK
ncbi:hypothetical protein CHS0354_040249 [Potamilus streckersoni]|uniref:U11/U12 small nuclear ribonucleoprotein 35 kDa protein n=1 Tax=Potamilus streckersoni TaxID=2493646 RepID=A0AAE0VQB5_9BIVA|nr:hypothetical protein CHS0354_040249 [Potamilus streckersoni]